MEKKDELISQITKNIGLDSLMYLPGKLVPAFIGFASLLIYTRIFSTDEYGEYSLIIATIGIISTFTYSWINASNLRYYSSYKANNMLNRFFSTSFYLILISIILSFFIVYILINIFQIGENISKYYVLVILYLISAAFFNTITTVLRADRKPIVVSLNSIMSSIFCLVISLLLVYFLHFGISALLIGYIVTNSSISLLTLIKFNYSKNINYDNFSPSTTKEFINYGLPLIGTFLFSWVLIMSDRYIIAYFQGNDQVGIYSAVYQLANTPLSTLSSLIMMAAFPIIIDAWQENGNEIATKIITNASRYYLLIAVPMFFGVTILSQKIMILLGESYYEGYGILPLISLGVLFSGLCLYSNKGLELYKKTNILLSLIAVIGLLNIGMNILFVPRYGYYGAGIATCLSYIIYFILSLVITRKYLIWVAPFSSLVNIIISCFVMSISLFNINAYFENTFLNLFILILIGAVVYFSTLVIIGELKTELTLIIINLHKLSSKHR